MDQDRLLFFRDFFISSKVNKLDSSELLSLATKFNKVEKMYQEKYKKDLIYKKIAILGSTTTLLLTNIIKLFFYSRKNRKEWFINN